MGARRRPVHTRLRAGDIFGRIFNDLAVTVIFNIGTLDGVRPRATLGMVAYSDGSGNDELAILLGEAFWLAIEKIEHCFGRSAKQRAFRRDDDRPVYQDRKSTIAWNTFSSETSGASSPSSAAPIASRLCDVCGVRPAAIRVTAARNGQVAPATALPGKASRPLPYQFSRKPTLPP